VGSRFKYSLFANERRKTTNAEISPAFRMSLFLWWFYSILAIRSNRKLLTANMQFVCYSVCSLCSWKSHEPAEHFSHSVNALVGGWPAHETDKTRFFDVVWCDNCETLFANFRCVTVPLGMCKTSTVLNLLVVVLFISMQRATLVFMFLLYVCTMFRSSLECCCAELHTSNAVLVL
jgi:hypothetical protein